MDLKKEFWPAPLVHCGEPLVHPTDERVIVAEVSSDPINGFDGLRKLYTALVPLEQLPTVLSADGGIGHGLSTAQAGGTFRKVEDSSRSFWIDGPGNSTQFEALVESWERNNHIILLPSNAFLMCYGLVPRILKDGSISWDDLARPVYDVVQLQPTSHFTNYKISTTARVTILRDYLEDYLSLKGCVAVATYWDERYSKDDPEVAAVLGPKGRRYKQPGRELWFHHLRLKDINQSSQVWACATLLVPTGLPVTDPVELELSWPDRKFPVNGKGRGSFEVMELAYVRDEVLIDYEKRSEYDIDPERGFVSYDSQWSVSFCQRYGRGCIELELRKLYEGSPPAVIKHYNDFAVSEQTANTGLKAYGTRNIGTRSKELVTAYLVLIHTLSELAEAVTLVYSPEDIGQFDSQKVSYVGWWTIPTLKPLGHVIPLTMAWSEFLARCKEIFNLLQTLQKSPLLQMVIRMGIKKEKVKDFQSLKLLSTICQLAEISIESGFNLVDEASDIAKLWDPLRKLDYVQPIFALNTLRVADAHSLGATLPQDILTALGDFGIDEQQCKNGWGRALDKVYDRMIESLRAIEKSIVKAWTAV